MTFTADFEKIFDDKLGYFAAAAGWREKIASGALEGEALANARASLSNAYLDGALSVFFLVMMTAFLAVGVKVCVATARARRFGAEFTSEEPFVESTWFAPSGLLATKLERKALVEYNMIVGTSTDASRDEDDADEERPAVGAVAAQVPA